jgi:hypothetical protein
MKKNIKHSSLSSRCAFFPMWTTLSEHLQRNTQMKKKDDV